MVWFHDDHDNTSAAAEVYGTEGHKAHWSHELIGGAAAFEAMKAYDEHQEANGKPQSHALAKDLAAGLAGAAVDHLVETKGLDFIDREKAKHHAKQETEHALANENFDA